MANLVAAIAAGTDTNEVENSLPPKAPPEKMKV
jgi:hypothetical protein